MVCRKSDPGKEELGPLLSDGTEGSRKFESILALRWYAKAVVIQ
jgi:hypothetical protein